MAITEGCIASIDSKEVTEDVKVTRIYYGNKWMKIERGDGTAEWVRAVSLKEKVVEVEEEIEEAP
jgi:hypothetical protein